MKVAIVMGSRSDLATVSPAVETLKSFGAECEVRVISAHRTPKAASEFAENAELNGIEVIIAAAGKAAHLAGVIAASTCLPVIGIPVKSSTLDGMDSLLSTVQMPSGVPVACVAINGAENAGLLAVQMLSLKYPALCGKLREHKERMAKKIAADDAAIGQETL